MHYVRDINVIIQSLQNCVFLQRQGEFKDPVIVLLERSTNPTVYFHDRIHLFDFEVSHVPLAIANNRLGVDPHASRMYCSILDSFITTFIPSTNSVHNRNGLRKFSLCLD